MEDLSGLMNKIKDVIPADQQSELVQKLTAFTLRLLYEMFQNLQNMGPLEQVKDPFYCSMHLNLTKLFACIIVFSFV
jgi:signal recognition particle GTPase